MILMSLRNQSMWLLIIFKMIYRILALFALLIWQLLFFEQVTVNASGERLENNFVNPTYRGDQRVSIINTSSDITKPVQVTQVTHWMIVKSILRTFVTRKIISNDVFNSIILQTHTLEWTSRTWD